VLLERDRLGQGTSKGGLGGIRHQFVDELDVRLSKLAVEFWRTFEDRTGARHRFQQRGYLFIAETVEGLAQLREPLPLYERVGVNVEMVDRTEIERLVPGIRTDDLAGYLQECTKWNPVLTGRYDIGFGIRVPSRQRVIFQIRIKRERHAFYKVFNGGGVFSTSVAKGELTQIRLFMRSR